MAVTDNIIQKLPATPDTMVMPVVVTLMAGMVHTPTADTRTVLTHTRRMAPRTPRTDTLRIINWITVMRVMASPA